MDVERYWPLMDLPRLDEIWHLLTKLSPCRLTDLQDTSSCNFNHKFALHRSGQHLIPSPFILLLNPVSFFSFIFIYFLQTKWLICQFHLISAHLVCCQVKSLCLFCWCFVCSLYGIIPLSGFGTGKKESASPFSCSVNVPNERQASAKNQGPLFKATNKCSRNVRATISTALDPQ